MKFNESREFFFFSFFVSSIFSIFFLLSIIFKSEIIFVLVKKQQFINEFNAEQQKLIFSVTNFNSNGKISKSGIQKHSLTGMT